MKKSLIFIIMILSMIGSCFALDLQMNQVDNLQDFYYKDSGNTQIKNAVGSVNNPYIVGNNTYSYDVDYEFTAMNEDFFLVLQNYVPNSSMTIMWRGDLTRDSTLYIQEFVMNEEGRYYFKFEPEYIDETGRIYIGFDSDTFVSTIEYIEQKPQGFNSLMGGFVNSFLSIVTINITMWRVVFYILIFALGVTFVAGLFGAGFYLFKVGEKIREKKSLFGRKE